MTAVARTEEAAMAAIAAACHELKLPAVAAEAARLAEQDRVADPDVAAPESVRSGRPSAPPA